MADPYPCPGHTHDLQHGFRLQVGSGGSASIVQSTLGLQVHPQVHMILADADVVYREFHGSTPGCLGPNLHPNLHDTCIHTPKGVGLSHRCKGANLSKVCPGVQL